MAGEKYLLEFEAGNLPADGNSADLTVRVHRDDAGTFADLEARVVGSVDLMRADEFHTDTVTDPVPTVVSVETNAAGDELTITFSEAVSHTLTDATDFTMTGHTLSSFAGTGTTRTLAVSPAVAHGDSDTLSYDASTGDLVSVSNGNAVATFSGQSITNTVPDTSWTPANLFGSSEEGFWYEISPSNCFTDTVDGTNAAVGDAVKWIKDSSGNNNHAEAPSGLAGILRQDAGGKYYLETSNDYYSISGLSAAAGPVTMAGAFRTTAGETNDLQYIIDIETGRLILAAVGTTAGEPAVYDGANWHSFDADTEADQYIVGLMASSGSLRIGGAEVATFSMTERALGGGARILNHHNGTTSSLNGRYYGSILRSANTTGSDLVNLETYLAGILP